MPAWMAGIQVRRMRPETSMSAWIPALHAGMTESRNRTKTDPGPPPRVFSKEITKATKVWIFLIENFLCPLWLTFFLRELRVLRGEFSSLV
jgi:hypothetical protein